MECVSPSLRRATIAIRVVSPRAAKIVHCSRRVGAFALSRRVDIGFNVLHLLCPTALVAAEGFEMELRWKAFESRFRQCEQGSRRGGLKTKLDDGARGVG